MSINLLLLLLIVRRRSHQGSSPDVLGVFVMLKNLADIPSIVGYRRIILLGRTRSHDVVQMSPHKIN